MSSEKVQGLAARLDQGLDAIKLCLNSKQKQHLLAYLHLFNKWNRAYNLSAVRDIEQMLIRHVLDSLCVHPYFLAKRCLDVGTGGGLPGIPLAITFPDRQFTLLDSNGKKTRFLFQVVSELGLQNVTVEQCRVEEKSAPPQFDGIVSRAFSTIDAMLSSSAHLLADNGLIYAMKGRYPEKELADALGCEPGSEANTGSESFKLESSHRLEVPNSDSERHLLILKRC